MITGTYDPSFQTRGSRHLPWCIVRICYIQQYQRKTAGSITWWGAPGLTVTNAYQQKRRGPVKASRYPLVTLPIRNKIPVQQGIYRFSPTQRWVFPDMFDWPKATPDHTSLSPFSCFKRCWLEKVSLPRGWGIISCINDGLRRAVQSRLDVIWEVPPAVRNSQWRSRDLQDQPDIKYRPK